MNVLIIPGMTGTGELLFVIFLVFVLFGAKKIPELMRSLGRAQGEYQKARSDFEKEVKATETRTSGKSGASAGLVFSPYADEDKARAKATELGLDTDGKTLEELNEAIANKVGGPTA